MGLSYVTHIGVVPGGFNEAYILLGVVLLPVTVSRHVLLY